MNLCAVVVLFNPTLDQVENKIKVLKNIPVIFIDNSNDPFEDWDFNVNALNIHYHYNGMNLGIAAAHNKGIEIAETLYKADYVLILDQDSDVGPFFLQNCTRDLELAENMNFAVIAPQLVNMKNQTKYKLDRKGTKTGNFETVNKASSSGSIIPIKTFNEIGKFKESLFIDLVDSEWCWRANFLGYLCLVSETNTLYHDIGEDDIHFMGLHFIRSKPPRMYYQYRNWLYLIRQKHVPIKWKIVESTKKILFIVIILFHSPTKQEFSNIFRGISEGFQNKAK